MLSKNARRKVRSLTGLAMNNELAIFWQFPKTLPQLTEWDVKRARDVA